MKTFKIWCYSILTIVILGFIGYTVYLAKKQIGDVLTNLISPISDLLHVLIACIIVLIIVATILSIIFACVYIYKHHTKTEVSEITEHGLALVTNGKYQTIKPHYKVEVRELKEKGQKLLEEKINVPTMKELLTSGYISNLLDNAEMLLGFRQEDISERIGTIEDNRTTGIAGKSRSGKTVTMVFLIIQYVLAGANVYLVDKAWNKASSLYHMVEPLISAGYIKVARKPMEITELTDEFTTMLDDRENGSEDMSKTKILVFDEWTSFMHDKTMVKKLVSIVHRIANESAGYNAYALIGGQNWQASQAGGNALINSLHSFFVHKIDELESKRILSRKFAKLTSLLKVGHNLMKDTSGDVEELITPKVTIEDSYIALAILQGKFNATRIDSYKNVFQYQPVFQPYNPDLLQSPKERYPINPNPKTPVLNQNDVIQLPANLNTSMLVTTPLEDTPMEELKPNPLHSKIPTLVSEDRSIQVTPKEQEIIQLAIDTAIKNGKVKANGKIIRTYLRDILQWDNRQYKKIEIFCNAKGY